MLKPVNAMALLYNDTEKIIQPIMLEFFMAVRILEGILAGIGNGLTLYAISRFTSLQTISNIFIIHLAATDVLGLPASILYVFEAGDLSMNDTWKMLICWMYGCLLIAGGYGSISGILMIGYERCLYLVYPLKYDIYITKGRVKCCVGIIWLMW